jgi:hypothetical protein
MRGLRAAVAVLPALMAAGCLVQIDHVKDPRAAFKEARAEALRYQGRPGPARQLNVLVYDRDERQLVRVALPMWLVRKIERNVDWDDERERRRRDWGQERAERSVRRHVRLEDIERAGLGILVEVEEDEGAQVLVWLR